MRDEKLRGTSFGEKKQQKQTKNRLDSWFSSSFASNMFYKFDKIYF